MAAPSPDGPEATLRSCSTGLDASSSNTGTGRPQIPGPGSRVRPPVGPAPGPYGWGAAGCVARRCCSIFGGEGTAQLAPGT